MKKPCSHASLRAQERYGLTLSPEMLNDITADILAGNWMLHVEQADGYQQMVGRVEGKTVRIVWAPITGTILTFLPLEAPLSKKRLRG